MKKRYFLIAIFFFLGIGTGIAQLTDMVTFPTGWPYGSLTLSNKLYGMTCEGGSYSKGTIFCIDTNAHNYKILHNFDQTDGAGPEGSLTLSGSKFFGMTSTGGPFGPHGEGVIFTIDTNGNNYKVIYKFCCTNGYFPSGDVIVTGSKLYGMASNGGAHSNGVIFTMDTNGSNYKINFNFHDSIGAYPLGDLTLLGAKFYGMTENGGRDYKGTVFSMDTDGHNYKLLLQFNDTNGGYPYGSLTLSGNKLYGTTSYGGAYYNQGTIFSVDTNGNNCKVLHSFDRPTGWDALGALNLSGGVLYGMTEAGGAYTYGVIFSIDTNGSNYSVLYNFLGGDGGWAYGGLTITGDVFYGLTYFGPDAYHGLAFKFYDTVMHVSTTGVNVTCNGGNNGYASASVGGGNSPYTYSWAPVGGSRDTLTGLSVGTYTVTVKDIHGYVGKDSITINPPAPLTVSDSVLSNALCNGGYNGSALVRASGGTLPYTYLWAPGGDSSANASSLSAGTYTITVHDSCGSSASAGVLITQPNAIHISLNVLSNVLCNGNSNGSATSNVNGGISPFTYLWSNGGTLSGISNLKAGTYTLVVKDKNGCIDSATTTITQPNLLNVPANITSNELCNGERNGSISSNANGGTLPYTYLWSPSGGSSANASGLTAGSYTLVVHDSNGCSAFAIAAITQPAPVTIVKHTLPDDGNGGGSAWVKVSGGISPYTYLWSPGRNTTDSISNKQADIYCCTVTDANGCIDSVCITINSDAGINNLASNSGRITVYPNPGNGTFQLGIKNEELGNNNRIEVYNVLGERVYSQFNIQNSTFNINISSQPNGIYLYRVITGNGDLIGEGKMVIQK